MGMQYGVLCNILSLALGKQIKKKYLYLLEIKIAFQVLYKLSLNFH